jgi:hypothetical protein
MKKIRLAKTVICLITFFASSAIHAAEEKSVTNALKNGTPYLDMRYRYEFVDQKSTGASLNEGRASTLRTKLGYKTGEFAGVSALAEVENIVVIGPERYNNGTKNAKTNYATVADAPTTLLNQAYFTWKAEPKSKINLGRQAINLDNQRFVGSVAWRQNDQTFDAVAANSEYFKDFTIFYSYANQVNRVFGPGSQTNLGRFRDTNINLINVAYTGLKAGKLTAYEYLLNIPTQVASSSKTSGLRFVGSQKFNENSSGIYSLEYAKQGNYANSSRQFNVNYLLVEPGVKYKNFTAKAGYESLGSNGISAFQTPLATLHIFNGWADKFLTTPANGLIDMYGSLEYKFSGENCLKNVATQFAYHDFSSVKQSIGYGTEYNFQITKEFSKNYNAGLKVARYEAANLFTNTTKVIMTLQAKF